MIFNTFIKHLLTIPKIIYFINMDIKLFKEDN